MSWSWIFFGDFSVPKASLALAQSVFPPRLTPLDEIRRTAALSDVIYEGERLHLRQVFEKSLHDDVVDELEQQLAALVPHGLRGTGCVVGFSLDGGPDDVGTSFTLGGGKLERREMNPKELAAAATAKEHEATVARFEEAYEGA